MSPHDHSQHHHAPHHHSHHHGHTHHHEPAPVRAMIGAPSLMRLSAMQRLGGACVLSGILFALLLWCLNTAGA
jgi:ABC-type nickel/cobalt efflux system permease component RcnA